MKIHIVKKGESLYQLSKKYNVDLDKLIEFNPQIEDPDKIDVGTKVKIPSPSIPMEPPESDIAHKHIVKQGDTLWKLSKKWGIPLKAMIDANPQLKNPSILMTGQLVYIPKWNPDGGNQPNVPGEASLQELNVMAEMNAMAESNLMPEMTMPVPPHKKNTAPIVPEAPILPMAEEVKEEIEEVKEEVKEAKEEIKEEAKEVQELLKEKVEPKEVVELEEIKEVAVEKEEEKAYPSVLPFKENIHQEALEENVNLVAPLEKESVPHSYPSIMYTEHLFEQYNVPAVEAAVEYTGWAQANANVEPQVSPYQDWSSWPTSNEAALNAPYEYANLPQLSGVDPNVLPQPQYAPYSYESKGKHDCGCQGHHHASYADYPGLQPYSVQMTNVSPMANVSPVQEKGKAENKNPAGTWQDGGHIHSAGHWPHDGGNVQSMSHWPHDGGNVQSMSHWPHDGGNVQSMGYWPHDVGNVQSMGHWPQNVGSVQSMGHWPHDGGNVQSMGYWPHDGGNVQSMGYWPQNVGSVQSMGHWPHDGGNVQSMSHWPHDGGYMQSMGHWPHDGGYMQPMSHWPQDGGYMQPMSHWSNSGPIAKSGAENVSASSNANLAAQAKSGPKINSMPNLEAAANAGSFPNMGPIPYGMPAIQYGAAAVDPYYAPYWSSAAPWTYGPMVAPYAGSFSEEKHSNSRGTDNEEPTPGEEAENTETAEIKKNSRTKTGGSGTKASLHSYPRKKKKRSTVKKTKTNQPWINY
ncbi:LysM peptidoglycan-binding domain-containing protein [Paenibacillus sp. 32O-W]|uniref:LysM peptidoglycan-binding domain-containing protein n=1 Tax=Paenibacillus sp. 32O-W TaxID=1695218 RepID=UPI0011A76EE9|nr:LysM peptidoglycan-binding domain-containing protein [Paenibacillus sp. 32O-W]